MRERRRIRLSIGFVVSVVVHGAALLPLLAVVMTSSGGDVVDLDPSLDPIPPVAPETPDEPEVPLGLETSDASTLTWIGYDEYEEHLAKLAETEQAAMTATPSGGEPSPPQPMIVTPTVTPTEADASPAETNTPPVPETPVDEARTPTEADAAPGEVTTSDATAPPDDATPIEATDANDPDVRGAEEPADATAATPNETDEPETGEPAVIAPVDVVDDGAEMPSEHETDDPSPAEPHETNDPTEASPSQPSQPTPPGEPEETEPVEADPSDLDAPATSRVEIALDDLKVGKPLAAHGLELKPRRPSITTLTRLTASPGNPIVEIRFSANGKPSLARILRSSGDGRIDSSIKASLYRWRATGAPLAKLSDDETVDVEIELILNPRAR